MSDKEAFDEHTCLKKTRQNWVTYDWIVDTYMEHI